MSALLQDIRYGVRMLRKNPSVTLMAVLTLILGIGANSTVFSWASATLLDPIPGMAAPSEVISVNAGVPGHLSTLSYPDYADLRAQNKVFSGLTAFTLWSMSITEGDRPERIFGSLVSANYFDVLGVHPVLGRTFVASEEAAPGSAPVAVISYRLWLNRYQGNPAVLGRTIPLNQHRYAIVGVAPPEFQGSFTALRSEIWIPVVMDGQLIPGGSRLSIRGNTWLTVLGRLRRGVSREEARTALDGDFQQLVASYPEAHQSLKHVSLIPLWRAPGANLIFSVVMPMLLAVAGLLLLLTCANVANLMLVRAVSRMRELALRLSLGASRARLIRQLLIEALLLALLGAAGALLLTRLDSGLFMNMAPHSDLPIWVNVHLNRQVFLFTLVVSLATAILFGILPALRASSASPIVALKDESASLAGGRGKARLSSVLAVAQISLSLVLLISASLFVQSFRKAQQFSPGFNPNRVFVASYDLFPNGYDAATGVALDRQILDKVATVPGVQSVALADWVPLGFSSRGTSFLPEGYAPKHDESMAAGCTSVSPGYFHTLEIPLVQGRDFTAADTPTSLPVVIVNEHFAARYWPSQEPLGKRVQIDGVWKTVVGVAQNSEYYDLNERPHIFVYLPIFQSHSPEPIVLARTAGDPAAFSAAIQNAIHEVNAELPLFDVGTLREHIEAASTVQRVAGPATAVLGLLALILAAVGVYGVIAYTTSLRTQEIGVRIALGAQHGDILRLVLRGGAMVTIIGLVLGSAGALLLMRLASSLLFGVSASDPATFLLIPTVLGAVILLACYVPARRATRLDPLVALRYH
jgi:predicted permease